MVASTPEQTSALVRDDSHVLGEDAAGDVTFVEFLDFDKDNEESKRLVEADRSATIKVIERSIFFALEKKNFGTLLQVAPKLESLRGFQ